MFYIGSLPLVFSNKLCRLQPPMCDGQGCVLSCFSYIELFEKEVRLHRTVRLLPVCVCACMEGQAYTVVVKTQTLLSCQFSED